MSPVPEDLTASSHSAAAGEQLPARRGVSAAAICAHIEQHLGKIEHVFPASAADAVPVDVHHVAPITARPVHTLVTTGMSDYAMQVPVGVEAPRHLELMITLPQYWRVGDASDEWSWPMRQLLALAQLPYQHHSWLGWGHTVPNGEPPIPLAASTKLCGAIIAPSLLVPSAFYELVAADRAIAFYSVVPLYKEEMALRQRAGMEELLSRFVDHDINDVVQPRRRNVAKRLFGLL